VNVSRLFQPMRRENLMQYTHHCQQYLLMTEILEGDDQFCRGGKHFHVGLWFHDVFAPVLKEQLCENILEVFASQNQIRQTLGRQTDSAQQRLNLDSFFQCKI